MTNRDDPRSTTPGLDLLLIAAIAALLVVLRNVLDLSWLVTAVIALALSVGLYLWMRNRRS